MAGSDPTQNLVDELALLREELVVLRESLDEFRVDSTNVLRTLAQQLIAQQGNEPANNSAAIPHSPRHQFLRKKVRLSPYFIGQLAQDYHRLLEQDRQNKKTGGTSTK